MRRIKNDEFIFVLTVEDIQEVARKTIGRELSDDELHRVKAGIEAGLMWYEVTEEAVREVVVR
ncbi:MAG TPA: hypothetical protein ENG51_01175 [Deltaproteobacteria bacterium]|nr:MAG: hypothetical protein DRJ03_23965 [Chloroflexota bacterium]HDM75065.1 hypothetical protein [Deltaproteobacteria bacterium]